MRTTAAGAALRGLAIATPLCLATAAQPAHAQDQDLAALHREMEQMRQQYDAALKRLQQQYERRLGTMEKRLEAAEKEAAAAKAQAGAAQQAVDTAQQPPTPAPAPAATAEAAPAPAPAPAAAAAPAPASAQPGGEAASAAAFNPAIGAVLNGTFMAANHNPNTWRVPG
ncbi:MAG TPA: hypothetical protein VFA22_03555, partial [Stellaceae bacterium]|nr:hypothetical protein [Stellaceae bacterium]